MSDFRPRRPLVLDGPVGTRLIALGLDLDHDDPSVWNLLRPDDVLAIHAADVAAGADAVLTNTMGGNRAWLARYGRGGDVKAINRRAVALARTAAGPNRLVIGSVGPAAANEPDAVRDQVDFLAEAGVDAILFETCARREASDLIAAVNVRLPLIASFYATDDGLGDELRRLEDAGVAVVGINCSPGCAEACDQLQRLRALTDLPLWVKPNGGPTEGPQQFAAAVPQWLALGVRFLGGCCGATEAHVAAIRAACDAEETGGRRQ